MRENYWGCGVAMLFQTVELRTLFSSGNLGSQRRFTDNVHTSWQLREQAHFCPQAAGEVSPEQATGLQLAQALRGWECKEEVPTPAIRAQERLFRGVTLKLSPEITWAFRWRDERGTWRMCRGSETTWKHLGGKYVSSNFCSTPRSVIMWWRRRRLRRSPVTMSENIVLIIQTLFQPCGV